MCKLDQLPIAQWYYSLGGVNNHEVDVLFRSACARNRPEMAKWLYSLGGVESMAGHKEVAQWLYTLEDIDIHADEESLFILCCNYGQLEVAQWLFSLGGVNIHAQNNTLFSDSHYDRMDHTVVVWLRQIGRVLYPDLSS